MNHDKFLKIRYDSTEGIALKDGNVENYCRQLNYGDHVTVASELVIACIRALIVEKFFDYSYVIFYYHDLAIHINKDGGLSFWPDGFADVLFKFTIRTHPEIYKEQK
jgi:hypothetical protein